MQSTRTAPSAKSIGTQSPLKAGRILFSKIVEVMRLFVLFERDPWFERRVLLRAADIPLSTRIAQDILPEDVYSSKDYPGCPQFSMCVMSIPSKHSGYSGWWIPKVTGSRIDDRYPACPGVLFCRAPCELVTVKEGGKGRML